MSNGNGTDWCDQPPLDVATFRTMFPAFADPIAYPDATIQIWLNLAPVDPCVWAEWYHLGQGLWTAHEIAKFQLAAQQAAAGNPSGVGGIVASKSVGPVSVSYDNELGAEEGAGQYNLTIYGRQFIHYARLLGMGPYQIGAISPPPYGTPWIGPPPLPGWFG